MQDKIITIRWKMLAAIATLFVMFVILAASLPSRTYAAATNDCYSYEGAIYGVYKTKASSASFF